MSQEANENNQESISNNSHSLANGFALRMSQEANADNQKSISNNSHSLANEFALRMTQEADAIIHVLAQWLMYFAVTCKMNSQAWLMKIICFRQC